MIITDRHERSVKQEGVWNENWMVEKVQMQMIRLPDCLLAGQRPKECLRTFPVMGTYLHRKLGEIVVLAAMDDEGIASFVFRRFEGLPSCVK